MVSTRFVIKMNDFGAKPAKMRAAVGKRVHAAGFRAEGRAKGAAKKDTGHMANSTANRPSGPLSTTIAASAEYSGYLDMGTRYIPADRWFSGSVEAEVAALEASFAGLEGELA